MKMLLAYSIASVISVKLMGFLGILFVGVLLTAWCMYKSVDTYTKSISYHVHRFVICPGVITDTNTNKRHHIGSLQLIRLYELKEGEYIVWHTGYKHQFGDIVLRPSAAGDYDEIKEQKIQLFYSQSLNLRNNVKSRTAGSSRTT